MLQTVQFGAWKIAVDVDQTKIYYAAYKKSDTQANRNFSAYCKNLPPEEKAFFDAFGIDPVCCEIEHIGVDRKRRFPCGGYYLICGKYLDCPPEELITVDELAENDFTDERPDPRVTIGIFQFDFQCEEYEFKNIPEDMPEGYLCIRFWCDDMKWLLSEKPEQIMYEPPRFWEIHKIIKARIENIKQQALYLEETKRDFLRFFHERNVDAVPLDRKSIREYKKAWVHQFAPKNGNRKEILKYCLDSRKYTPFLWHMFSFGFLSCTTGNEAKVLFDEEQKFSCIMISNVDELAYRLQNAGELTAESLEPFVDVTVTADDSQWTYTKTHESLCGPYFYRKSSPGEVT